MRVLLVNFLGMTAEGTFRNRRITVTDAQELIDSREWESAIGHPATAEILGTLLGVHIPAVNQIVWQQVGQPVIAFKLNGRPTPGRELSRSELEEIGFSLHLVERLA